MQDLTYYGDICKVEEHVTYRQLDAECVPFGCEYGFYRVADGNSFKCEKRTDQYLQKEQRETSYHFKGTFSLPYANITQDMEVWYDESTGREKISYYNDTDYSIWDLNNKTSDKFYGVFTYLPEGAQESTQYCTLTPTLGLLNDTLSIILPDLSTWTKLEDTKIMNKVVAHYRLNVIDGQGDGPARAIKDEQPELFNYARED